MNEALRVEIELAFKPRLALLQDTGPVLLGRIRAQPMATA